MNDGVNHSAAAALDRSGNNSRTTSYYSRHSYKPFVVYEVRLNRSSGLLGPISALHTAASNVKMQGMHLIL